MSKLVILLIIVPFAGALLGVWLNKAQEHLDKETEANFEKAKSLRAARKTDDPTSTR